MFGTQEYIEVFRKPGDNAVPIQPDISNDDWIKHEYAEAARRNLTMIERERGRQGALPL